MHTQPYSLRSFLTNRLLTALYLLWLISTIMGYFATLNYANKPHDLILLQRAQSVAEQLSLGKVQAHLDRIPDLPDGKDPAMPDQVVYTVSDENGKKLAGNASISRPLSYRRGKMGALFSNGERAGKKTRMVSLVYTHPIDGRVLQLHVSETTLQRQALIKGILAYIVIPQLLLILLAWAAVWYGLKVGLSPLERLRREVAARQRDDLHRLERSSAPLEVHPLIDSMNELLERVEQLLLAQKRFVSDAAHQLRTPLAGLKTQVELALREAEPERKQEILQHAQTSTQHAAHLVNQLLMLARNEPGGQGMGNFTPVALCQLARDCAMDWVPTALDKDIDLGFAGNDTAVIQGDTDSLREMLGNLIDNAIRYTLPQGEITVSVSAQPNSVTLSVEDNGSGIPVAHRERVLERFYRILGSGQSGSGLGLAIAAEVAKRHGAKLSIHDGKAGVGTRFDICFPQADNPISQ